MKKFFLLALLAITSSLSATQVLVFAGSLRTDSYNKLLARQAAEIVRAEGSKAVYVDLKDFPMPFYDADLESAQGMPESAKKFRNLMIASDAVVISTPQYNDSIPAVLKNAIDWASRGENGEASRDAFKGKKFALMSASPRKKGGAKALAHLSEIIKDCGGDLVAPQVSVPFADQAFDAQGHLKDSKLTTLLGEEIRALL